MATNLVIVESPAKAKTISKYLNSNAALKSYGKFIVESSKGHVRDLKKKSLGIEIEHNFKPIYEVLPEKMALITALRKHIKKGVKVWLAADFDREGEAICMHLRDCLNLKDDYHRITFTEITPKALENAIKNPRKIDNDVVDAQETRRILDRLVGFQLSPLLWKRYSNVTGLSAGRVQSALLHMILQREEEIQKFQSNSYYYYQGWFLIPLKKPFELEEIKLFKDGTVFKADKETLLKDLEKQFRIGSCIIKSSKQNPDAPFITSSFQQEAFNKLGLSINRAMQIAQELYENGYITYMRTDSYNIAVEFQETAQTFIKNKYGSVYWAGLNVKKQSKNSQEAHEAIRPTDIIRVNIEDEKMKAEHRVVYQMIWKRTVAAFMKPAVYNELHIDILNDAFTTDQAFKGILKLVKFNGYLVVYGVENEADNLESLQKEIQGIKKVTCNKIIAKNTWTSPPTHYNESSLVKLMETEGIGRPSSYTSIIQKLIQKQYIIITDIAGQTKDTINYTYQPSKSNPIQMDKSSVIIGQEKRKVLPLEIGKDIKEFLEVNFPYIVDKTFTCSMELDLDRIAERAKSRDQVLTSFWKVFGKDVENVSKAQKSTPKKSITSEQTEFEVEGKKYIVRMAKYGPVIEIKKQPKSEFINIKHYLKATNKSYLDMTKDDIHFLIGLPYTLKDQDGNNVEFLQGQYGFYLKSNKGNHRIPPKVIKTFIEGKPITPSLITSFINYKKKTQTTDAE